MDKSYIFLKSPIGSGGEANIYTVRIKPELVAKVYHQPHGDYARKLAFMVANPPIDPLASSGRVSIAWATELVTDLGLVVGFLMPKLDTSKAKPIFQYYNPSERRKESPTFSYISLIRTARNLARAVRSVHSRGYVIGDVNESNVLVADDAIVTLVDTDSFQVNDGTTIYRCTVGKPEYTPPELQGMSFRDVDRSVEHDLFGLGVLIYQLLMEGTHPFDGVFTGQGEAPERKDRIKSGHFPHGQRRVPYKSMPLISFQMLPVALQELFLLCFEEGHGNPAARPTADVWSKALGDAEDGLVRCGVNGQHHYSGHLGVCPWCERAAKLGGRDPFPALGAIRSGQHLKPAAIGKAVGKPILKAMSNPSPTRKPSIPNSTPSPVITPQVVIATPQTLSQPQPISQPAIANNPSIRQSPISSYPTVSIKTSNLITSYGNELCKTIVLTICIILLAQNITVGLIGGAIFLVWEFISKSYNSCIVAFSPDGKTIITRSSGGTTKLWSIDGRLIQTLTWDSRHGICEIALSPDGKMISTGSDFGRWEDFDYTAKLRSIDGKLLQTFTAGHLVTSVAFSPNGKMLATGGNTAKLWSLDGREIQTFTGHSWIKSIAFSADGKMIAAGGSETVKLWSLDGREIQTFTGHSSNVSCVAFSPDGKMIATGSRHTSSADASNILSRDYTAKLWSIDGRLLQTFIGHSDNICCVAFSPDGKMIATGSSDYTAKLWSIDGRLLQTFIGHRSSVSCVAFSHDGKMIATGSYDDTMKLWKI